MSRESWPRSRKSPDLKDISTENNNAPTISSIGNGEPNQEEILKEAEAARKLFKTLQTNLADFPTRYHNQGQEHVEAAEHFAGTLNQVIEKAIQFNYPHQWMTDVMQRMQWSIHEGGVTGQVAADFVADHIQLVLDFETEVAGRPESGIRGNPLFATEVPWTGALLQELLHTEAHGKEIESFMRGLVPQSVDYDELKNIWLASGNSYGSFQRKGSERRRNEIRNVLTIRYLERCAPGIVSRLHEDFGISHFIRYPEPILLEQYANIDRADIQYGAVFFARYDHGIALSGEFPVLAELRRSLGDTQLRIVECSGKIDIARALISFQRNYAQKPNGHKIKFAVVVGHGNEDLVRFGNNGSYSGDHLRKSDLQGTSVGRLPDFFESNPSLILSSCMTGKRGGIAQEISRSIHATVFAPDRAASTDKIVWDKDQSTFKVRYGLPAKTKEYRDGAPVERHEILP